MKEETGIQINLASYLRNKKIFFFSVPNEFTWRKQDSIWAFNMGMLAGTADLFLPKYRLFLEIKTSKGFIRPKQVKFAKNALKYGYSVEYPKSIDEAIKLINKYEVRRRRKNYRIVINAIRHKSKWQRMAKKNACN